MVGGDAFGEGFGEEAIFHVADFGDFEKVLDAAGGKVDADAPFENRAEPVGVEVIGIEVGEDDGGEIAEGDAGAVEAFFGGASAAGIDEQSTEEAHTSVEFPEEPLPRGEFERHPCSDAKRIRSLAGAAPTPNQVATILHNYNCAATVRERLGGTARLGFKIARLLDF